MPLLATALLGAAQSAYARSATENGGYGPIARSKERLPDPRQGNGGPEMFGFRVGDAANQLSLDGGDCTAADGLDDPHRPRRTRSKR